jgi:hypothetical protein
MAIAFFDNRVVFKGVVSVEDAEPLLEEMQKMSHPTIDFSECTHFHPANVQVLLAAGAKVKAWPADAGLAMWLQSALPS